MQDRFLSRTRELDEGDQWGNKEVEEEMKQRRQRRMQYCVWPHGVSIGAQQWAHAGGLLCGGAADDLLPSGTSGHNKLVVAAACCQIHLSILQPAPLQVLQETADSAASPVFVSVLHTLLNTFTPGSSTGEGLKKSSKVVLERRIVLTPGGRIINLSCLTQSRSYLGPKRWFTLFVGLVLRLPRLFLIWFHTVDAWKQMRTCCIEVWMSVFKPSCDCWDEPPSPLSVISFFFSRMWK